MTVWVEGRVIQRGDVPLEAAAVDRGALLGDGLFETLLVQADRVLDQAAHLDRLEASARALGFPDFARRRGEVAAAIDALLAEEPSAPRRVLRVTFTAGAGRGLLRPSGGRGRLVVSIGACPPPPSSVSAVLLDTPRVDPLCPTSGHKTTSALRWVLARDEARRRGAAVALVRCVDGDVVEGDAANLFLFDGEMLVTPPLDRGVLPGIQRARLLRAARVQGVDVEERPIAARELRSAGGLFLTSSLIGVVPVVELDGVPVAHHEPTTTRVRDLLTMDASDD